MLVDQVKASRMAAMRARNGVTRSILTTLLGKLKFPTIWLLELVKSS